jgi:hypothetical protein
VLDLANQIAGVSVAVITASLASGFAGIRYIARNWR